MDTLSTLAEVFALAKASAALVRLNIETRSARAG
jgi:hypothetical protein